MSNKTSNDDVIVVKDLVKSFNGRRVLDGINLTVKRGETMVIMGGSGCGKSTLLRHMVGLMKPDSGEIVINGKDITKLKEEEMNEVRKKIGLAFQYGALFNSMTVGENIALPLVEHTRLDPRTIGLIVKMKLDMVGLTGFENFKPSEISGGMMKRVGIARAIALDPQILFYDEPSAGLDPIVSAVIDKLMMDLSQKLNVTSVVVTHEMDSAFHISNRMCMLFNGRVVFLGTPDEIRKSDNELVKQFVDGAPDGPIPLRANADEYVRMMKGTAS